MPKRLYVGRYPTLAAAFKALCDAGLRFEPLYYAGPNPRHDAGFWVDPVRGGSVQCATITHGAPEALIWSNY